MVYHYHDDFLAVLNFEQQVQKKHYAFDCSLPVRDFDVAHY
jgi:hypothetical protein